MMYFVDFMRMGRLIPQYILKYATTVSFEILIIHARLRTSFKNK